jgi:hypothetical protein
MIGLNGGLLGSARTVAAGDAVGVWELNEQIIYRRQGLWPDDKDFLNVSLLLHMDGANNSTTFTDKSRSIRTITVNGNAKISTAQSKFGGASALLDGTTDWLYASPDTANFGTGDLTIECWVRWSSLTNAGIFHVFNGTPSSALTGLGLGWQSNTFVIYVNGAGSTRSYVPSTNTWYHIALVRSSGNLTLYVDGTAQGAAIANSTDYSNHGINIGLYYSNAYTLNGYIDEFRVTKNVARYTANFTPPAAPFPDA